MKITINRQVGILTLPEDFITLEDVTSTGYFRYVVKYNVDVLRAITQGCSIVKIHVSSRSPDTRDVPGFSALNSTEIVHNILTRTADRTEVNRSFTQGYITTVTSDLTSKVPNNLARLLSDSAAGSTLRNFDDQSLTQTTYLFEKNSFRLVRASELTNDNISQPTFQAPLYQPDVSDISPTTSPQENGYDLLLRYGIDPAVVGERTNHYVDTATVHAGILQRATGVAGEVLRGDPAGSTRAKFALLSTVLGSTRDRPADQLGLANNDYAQVLVKEKTNILTITEDLLIPISALGDQFYLVLELQDVKGIETENVSSVVHHARNLSVFTLPTVPPFISVTSQAGYNRVELRQLDPNGAGIYLYRKEIDAFNAITDADYVQVTRLPIRTQDGTKWYKDNISGLKSVVYRAVTYNRADLKSSEFASVVLAPSHKVLGVKTQTQRRRLFLSISAKVQDKSVQIEVNDVPSGVLALKVFRRDLSRNQSLENSTQVGKTIFISQLSANYSRHYASDQNVVDGRIYEYSALLTFRDGTEFWSPNPVTIHYNPVTNNVITTTSSPVRTVSVGSELDIVFTLNSVIAQGKMDQIKSAMESQGILGFFQSDIVTNREQLQSLIAYQIRRADLTTGEVENMGIFIGTDFSDRTQGTNLGVKKPEPFHVYEYTIDTHFRTAESLISTFTRTITDTVTPSRSYSFNPARWLHPVTLRDGDLISDESLMRNHASSDFTFGTIGNILHLRIALPNEQPIIQEAVANTLGRGKVLVQWNIRGVSKKIDHFLVIKEEMGMKTVVGKAHALTDTNNLQFIDTPMTSQLISANPSKQVSITELVDSGYETAATYHITPVLFDYSHGNTAKTAQIITKKIR